MVPITYNYSIHGVYKPSYNWGAPHCRIHENHPGVDIRILQFFGVRATRTWQRFPRKNSSASIPPWSPSGSKPWCCGATTVGYSRMPGGPGQTMETMGGFWSNRDAQIIPVFSQNFTIEKYTGNSFRKHLNMVNNHGFWFRSSFKPILWSKGNQLYLGTESLTSTLGSVPTLVPWRAARCSWPYISNMLHNWGMVIPPIIGSYNGHPIHDGVIASHNCRSRKTITLQV